MIKITEKGLQNFERAFGVVGFGIIVWMVYRLGPARIAANLHKVNWGFFLMFLSRTVRYLAQTLAWRLILAQEGKKIGFLRLFRINLEGESLNYITLTRIGGEPLKVLGLIDKIPLAQSAASVVVLKFCNIFGFWLVISLGFLAILFNTDVAGGNKKRGVFFN